MDCNSLLFFQVKATDGGSDTKISINPQVFFNKILKKILKDEYKMTKWWFSEFENAGKHCWIFHRSVRRGSEEVAALSLLRKLEGSEDLIKYSKDGLFLVNLS